jgi:hypothetical protein
MTLAAEASPTIEQLPELRRKTEAVARMLSNELAEHFETLRPLLSPERLFGKYAGGKTDVTGAEKALADLQQNFRAFIGKPYDLPKFDLSWLPLIGQSVALEPWEYDISVAGKKIKMTSPMKWVVVYSSNYSLAQVTRALNGSEPTRLDMLRQFVINALALALALSRFPKLKDLFTHLHWELKIETPASLHGLPLVTATSILHSFRPADELILAATSFSGIPAFIELIDLGSLQQTKDPFMSRVEQAMNA